MTDLALGVDIGGTNLRVGAVDGTGTVVARQDRPTPAGAGVDPDVAGRELVRTVADTARLVAGQAGLAPGSHVPLGIGFAGGISTEGEAVYGSNVSTRNFPLRDGVVEALGHADVLVVNDANAATWGEYRHGIGQDVRHLVMATVGTGVGGGTVVDGVLVAGSQGFGGEIGHMVVARDGWRCTCGHRGCLEAYASGQALARHARDLLAAGGHSVMEGLEVVEPRDVTAAAGEGDALAIEAIGRLGSWLGVGLASLVSLLDPELVVLGGGVSDHIGRWLLPATTRAMTNQMFAAAYRDPPAVRLATLGDTAGMIGAAEMARARGRTRA
ncbi:ROK family protein [Salsipaludibacter albus]|uniref:ROK family protein n=1 Tax=Salsipaludibacter albus TaxID=2849650 RepID=UPI001EE40173|nr:ROK family protein [Salsipaludibacter albus]MBY5164296.1 ROK family protein [Salsipaludibacter albus]